MATGTLATTARRNTLQVVHTLRFKVNYNDAGIATGNAKQYLPNGALVIGSDVFITTAFNAGTTNVLSIGYEASTYANLVTSAQSVSGSTGLKQNLPPNGVALLPLVGDQQVYALYTQTGTAATTGAGYVVIKYVVDNDLNAGQ